mgnify:CR=1 FL=1
MPRVFPRSLLGQSLLAIAITLLIGQAASAFLLYRAVEERRDVATANAAAFHLIRTASRAGSAEASSSRDLRRSIRRAERQAGMGMGPRDRGQRGRPLPPSIAGRITEESPLLAGETRDLKTEERLREILGRQGIVFDELVVTERAVLEDRIVAGLAQQRPRLAALLHQRGGTLLVAGMHQPDGKQWIVARAVRPPVEAGALVLIAVQTVLLFIVLKLLPPETERIAGGKEAVARSLAELGPMTSAQKRLLAVSIGLLLCWATEGKLHSFDTTSTTYAGLVILMLPRIGVMNWKEVQTRVPWGTVIVFGVGISLGTVLLTTQAGQWLGAQVVAHTGLGVVGPLGIFAILGAFLIVIHLGFASATALTSAMLPILISVLLSLPGDFSRLGMTMLLGFVVSYGFILPINAPQNMVCLGTETFSARQFAKVGVLVTLIGYLTMLLFAMTWWRWLGWI